MPVPPAAAGSCDPMAAAGLLLQRADDVRASAGRVLAAADWVRWRSTAARAFRAQAEALAHDLRRQAATLDAAAEQLRARARADLAAAGLGP